MADIRKRIGAKGPTYQVRYPSKATASGYAFATFATRKDALAFRDNSRAKANEPARHPEIRKISEGVQLWLDVCEKEGRNGREPITGYTLENYKYFQKIFNNYTWKKELRELTKPDMIEFRSWLLQNHSREVAHKALAYFHSVILELVSRQVMTHDIAAGVTISDPVGDAVKWLNCARDALNKVESQGALNAYGAQARTFFERASRVLSERRCFSHGILDDIYSAKKALRSAIGSLEFCENPELIDAEIYCRRAEIFLLDHANRSEGPDRRIVNDKVTITAGNPKMDWWLKGHLTRWPDYTFEAKLSAWDEWRIHESSLSRLRVRHKGEIVIVYYGRWKKPPLSWKEKAVLGNLLAGFPDELSEKTGHDIRKGRSF